VERVTSSLGPPYSSREWELLKKSGQRHEPTECHDGGGMHFDGMVSRLTC